MSKMNRRDYLIKMGAGAAAFATMGQQVLAQTRLRGRRRRLITKPRKSPATVTTAAATGGQQFTNWPTTDVLPDFDASPFIIIFGGLFGFFYNGTCDVRYHPGNKHHPTVQVWREGSSTPKDIPLTGRCKRIVVEINRQQSNVKFYEEHPDRPFTDRMTDSYDFRWLLDLDSEDFYANYNFKLLDKFNRLVKVRHGTFFTALPSCSTFSRVNVDDNDSHPVAMGRMPLFMGAALNPNANEYVSVLFQETRSNQFVTYDSRTFKPADGKVTVTFLNHCEAAHGCPTPDPHASDDEDRNDFHFVRDALDLKSVPRYGLKINSDCRYGDVKSLKSRSQISGLAELYQMISDNAPCMGGGFGGR